MASTRTDSPSRRLGGALPFPESSSRHAPALVQFTRRKIMRLCLPAHPVSLRNSNFGDRSWLPALSKAGLAGTHFHDLRHTGNVLAEGTAATLRELLNRMGHNSNRAAMIYMHASGARQHDIATR
jgi:integrase